MAELKEIQIKQLSNEDIKKLISKLSKENTDLKNKSASKDEEILNLKNINASKDAEILSQNAQILDLKTENEKKDAQILNLKTENEAILKQCMKEKFYFIDENIYKKYDSEQQDTNDNIQMKIIPDKIKCENEFNKFKNSVSSIDTKINNKVNKINNTSNISKFLDKNDLNNIINHKFGDNMTIDNFLKAFNNAIINNINKNWELQDRKTLKAEIEKMYNEVKKIFYNEIPEHIKQLKLDMLLSSILSKEYIEKDINANFVTINTQNYSTIPLGNGIKFLNPIDDKEYKFNKDYIIKKITNNVGIMNAYYKTIQKFITNKFDKSQLKKTIIQIVNNTNIYFCDLPKSYLGVTICNGDIFISGKYLQEALHKSDNKYYNFTAISKIYLTILHEIAHKLQYTLRKDYKSEDECNYFIKTFFFKTDTDRAFDLLENIQIDQGQSYYQVKFNVFKKLNNDELDDAKLYEALHTIPTECESGDFFDNEIYLGKKQTYVTKKISEFFLLSSCERYNDYIEQMKNLFEGKNSERTTNANYKFIGEGETLCYHSYIRGYN